MKHLIILLICVLIFPSVSCAQRSNPAGRDQVGVTISTLGSNDVVSFVKMMGGASYYGDGFLTVGISYLHPITKILDLESGLEYSSQKIKIRREFMPGMSLTDRYGSFSLISLPIGLRLNFLRYFFLSGSFFLASDASTSMPIDSQTGIGANFGLGFKYSFRGRMSVFVNPYQKMHSIVYFSTPGSSHQHLWESGFRFGFLYTLK